MDACHKCQMPFELEEDRCVCNGSLCVHCCECEDNCGCGCKNDGKCECKEE